MITDIDDLIFVVDLEPLLGDCGHFPFGVVISVRLVEIDDVLPEFTHLHHEIIIYQSQFIAYKMPLKPSQ